MKDATSRELEIGNIYGYSIDQNGIIHVTIGKFTHYTEKGYASLDVIQTKKAYGNVDLYDHEIEKKRVFVKSNKLFKI